MPSFSNPISVTGTTPASPSTAAIGNPVKGIGKADSIKVVAELVGATGGVLDVYLQWTPDSGTTFYDLAHFPQLAAGAAAIKYVLNLSSGGENSPISVVGKNLVPALPANTNVGGPWGDQIRVVAVAGASTSAGAAITVNFYVVTLSR